MEQELKAKGSWWLYTHAQTRSSVKVEVLDFEVTHNSYICRSAIGEHFIVKDASLSPVPEHAWFTMAEIIAELNPSDNVLRRWLQSRGVFLGSECNVREQASLHIPDTHTRETIMEMVNRPDINAGVWYASKCSGLWYQNPKAAGTVGRIRIDGVTYPVLDLDNEPFKEEDISEAFIDLVKGRMRKAKPSRLPILGKTAIVAVLDTYHERDGETNEETGD